MTNGLGLAQAQAMAFYMTVYLHDILCAYANKLTYCESAILVNQEVIPDEIKRAIFIFTVLYTLL